MVCSAFPNAGMAEVGDLVQELTELIRQREKETCDRHANKFIGSEVSRTTSGSSTSNLRVTNAPSAMLTRTSEPRGSLTHSQWDRVPLALITTLRTWLAPFPLLAL